MTASVPRSHASYSYRRLAIVLPTCTRYYAYPSVSSDALRLSTFWMRSPFSCLILLSLSPYVLFFRFFRRLKGGLFCLVLYLLYFPTFFSALHCVPFGLSGQTLHFPANTCPEHGVRFQCQGLKLCDGVMMFLTGRGQGQQISSNIWSHGRTLSSW